MLRPIAQLADAEIEALLFKPCGGPSVPRRAEVELASVDAYALERLVAGLLALRGHGHFIES